MRNKSTKKLLAKNTFALVIIEIMNYVLPFIIMPYLSRILEVDKLGLIFYAQAVIDYFSRFVTFGFDNSGVRQIAVHINNKKSINLIFNSILGVQIILLLVGFILLSIIVFGIEKLCQDWIVYYFTYLSVVGNVLIFRWFYQGIENMKFITILSVITRFVALLLIVLLIKQPTDYYLVPLLNASGVLVAGLVSLLVILNRFKIKLFIPNIHSMLKEFKYSSEFFLAKIGVCLYSQTNTFVLGLVLTTTAVAYYVSADRIFVAAVSLYGTFINALFPFMTKTKDIKFFKKILKLLIFLSFAAAFFLFIMSKLLIILLFTEKMTGAVQILKIFSFAFMAYVFVETLGFPLLGAFGYVKETNQGYMLGGLYDIIGLLVLYLTNNITTFNVALLSVSTFIVILLHRIYMIKKFNILGR